MKKADAGRSDGFEVLYVRIPAHLKGRLQEASAVQPYRVSITAIVERGIELALQELQETRKRKYVATLNYRSSRG